MILKQNSGSCYSTGEPELGWQVKSIFFFSLSNFPNCFSIILLCFEVEKHLWEWPETLPCSFHGLTRALKEVAARLTPKEHNRQVGPSLLTWGQMSSFLVHFVITRWLRTAAVSLRIFQNGFCALPSVSI